MTLRAPEGATHAAADGRFYKLESEWFYSNYLGHWKRNCSGEPEGAYVLPSKPEATGWNGPEDGLPPVGTVCEVKNERHGRTDKKWIVCEIAYISEHYAILKSDELIGQKEAVVVPSDCLFRPIRTAEQLAAEEREQQIEKMLATINYAPWEAAHYKLFAQRLYDAGARMPVQP